MSRKTFQPHSRQQDERLVTRVQKDFSQGVFADIPASQVPDTGIAYLKNFINHGYDLCGRSGSQIWGNHSTNTPCAALPGTNITNLHLSTEAYNGSNTRTTISTVYDGNSYVFSSDDVGKVLVFDDGYGEVISAVGYSAPSQTYTISTTIVDSLYRNYNWFRSLSAQIIDPNSHINALYYSISAEKFIVHLGTNIYVSEDKYASSWNRALCSSLLYPKDELSTFDELQKDIILFNTNGVFRIDVTNKPHFYYKINSEIPTQRISDNQVDTPTFKRKYIYTLSKFSDRTANRNGRIDSETDRTTPGTILKLDSGSNIIDTFYRDYAEYQSETLPLGETEYNVAQTKWLNSSHPSGYWGSDSPYYRYSHNPIISGFKLPTVSGTKTETNWDCFSIWGTKDVSPAGLDPISGIGNNSELYIWLSDVPIRKCFTITTTSTASGFSTFSNGSMINIINRDIGSPIYLLSGGSWVSGTINQYVSGDVMNLCVSGLSASLNTIGHIGAEKCATFTITGTTITPTVGDSFSVTDIGKRIFMANGDVHYLSGLSGTSGYYIKELTGGSTAGQTVGCWGETGRKFFDDVSDDMIQSRIAAYPLYQRFYQPLPECNIGLVAPGWMFTGSKDDYFIYYSQIPDGFDYLTGYYHPTYQMFDIKDKVQSLKLSVDRLVVWGTSLTGTVNLNIINSVTIPNIGVDISVLPGVNIVDSIIGTTDYTSVTPKELGKHILITNEGGIREFDGVQYSNNYASLKLTSTLRKFNTYSSAVYTPYLGYMFWNNINDQDFKCFSLGFNNEQGMGFSEITGNWPTPPKGVAPIKLIDDNGYQRTIVLDQATRQLYDISLREGSSTSNLQKYFKDRLNISGGDGYDITPEVTFKEDTGEYEKFVCESLANRFYIRPDQETNRSISGFDSSGFITGTQFTVSIFADGEPTTQVATASNIKKNNEIVYDRKAEGHRLQTKFSSNKSGFRIVGRQQEYIVKDIDYDIDNKIATEHNYQSDLSEPILWFSRGSSKELVSDTEVNGITSYISGPDSRTNSAISSSGIITLPNISSVSSKTILMWVSGYPRLNFGSFDSSYSTWSTYSGFGSWSLKYISGLTTSGAFTVRSLTSDPVRIFDVRIADDEVISDLEYYFNDVTQNHANNVCPLF